MPTLTWTDDLRLDQPRMDLTHREFVDALAEVERLLDADPAARRQAYEALLAHTVEHFAQEDRWMDALGFAPQNCHAYQHAGVLEVMREVLRRADADDWMPMRIVVAELAAWFPQHARMMDAALAQTMAERGFDAATGQTARPQAAGAEPITGCGSHACA